MKRVKEYNYQCPFLLTHILAKLMLRITRKSCHFLPKVLPHRLIHANWLVWRNEAKRAKKATLCLCSGSRCGQPACSERSSLLYPCGKPFGRKGQTFPVIGTPVRIQYECCRLTNMSVAASLQDSYPCSRRVSC